MRGIPIADSSCGLPRRPISPCALVLCITRSHENKNTHNTHTQAAPPSLRSELPSMALLTLLYFIQGVPLGLTMGSV